MIKMKNILATILFLTIILGGAYAKDSAPSPTIIGSTGLVRMPNAYCIPYKNFNVGLEYGVNSFNGKPIAYYKANLGTFQNFEVGFVGGTDRDGNQLREGVFINMKYSLIGDSSAVPWRFAIGIENLSSNKETDVYMVATKPFIEGPNFSFGFMGDFPGNEFRPLGMTGLEFPFADSKLVIMGDLFAGGRIFQFDFGGRIYFTQTFALHINGVNIFDNPNDPKGKDAKCVLAGFSWANPF